MSFSSPQSVEVVNECVESMMSLPPPSYTHRPQIVASHRELQQALVEVQRRLDEAGCFTSTTPDIDVQYISVATFLDFLRTIPLSLLRYAATRPEIRRMS